MTLLLLLLPLQSIGSDALISQRSPLDWRERVLPYSWEARGGQLRMKAIVRALMSLSDRPEKFGRINLQSSITANGVTVRLDDIRDAKKMLKRATFGDIKPLDSIPKAYSNAYSAAAVAFYATASETLSDADPRWNSFTIDVSEAADRDWTIVTISRPIGDLQFGLERGILLHPSLKSPTILVGHGLR